MHGELLRSKGAREETYERYTYLYRRKEGFGCFNKAFEFLGAFVAILGLFLQSVVIETDHGYFCSREQSVNYYQY